MRVRRTLVAVMALAISKLVGPDVAAAADPADDPPDPAFLEYRGSWQGDDDAWVVLEDGDNASPRVGRAVPPAQNVQHEDHEPKRQDDK